LRSRNTSFQNSAFGTYEGFRGVKGYYEGLKTLLNPFKPFYRQLTAHIEGKLRVEENPKKDDNIIRIITKYNINTYYTKYFSYPGVLSNPAEDVDFLENRTLTPSFFALSSKFQTDRLPAPNPNELKALQSQTSTGTLHLHPAFADTL
jgi:hypothetical protein